MFYFDDIRSHIGQEHATVETGRDVAKLNNLDAPQRQLLTHLQLHFYLLTTTITRPRTLPSSKSWDLRSACSSPITSLLISSNLEKSRSFARRFHALIRSSRGHCTLSIPISDTPRRMNGATLAGKSIPCARPHAVTTPRY